MSGEAVRELRELKRGLREIYDKVKRGEISKGVLDCFVEICRKEGDYGLYYDSEEVEVELTDTSILILDIVKELKKRLGKRRVDLKGGRYIEIRDDLTIIKEGEGRSQFIFIEAPSV